MDLNGGAGFPWLGGRLQRSPRSWSWTDGTTWDYDNWLQGPVDEDVQDCVYITEYGQYFNVERGPWYSTQCSHSRPFVCKTVLV